MDYYSCKQIEFRDLFKHSLFLGGAVLCLPVFSHVLSLCFLAITMAVTGADFNTAVDIVNGSNLLLSSYNLFITLILFLFPFLIAAKTLGYQVSEAVRFNRPNGGRTTLFCVGLGLGFCVAGNIVTNIFSAVITNLTGYQPTQFVPPDAVGGFEIFMSFVTGAAMPALIEEFAFRGVLLGAMRKFGSGVAIAVSSILFAVMHGNFIQIPFALCVGIGLGMIAVISNSIWPAVLVHFLNNLFAEASVYLPDYCNSLISYLFIAAGIIGLIKLSRGGAFTALRDNVPSCYTAGKRTLLFFVSPTVILSLLYFIVEAFDYFQAV